VAAADELGPLATVFEEAGFSTISPGWPDDPNTVAEANAHPEVLAHKTVGQIADHFEDVVGMLTKRPAVIGHNTYAVPGSGVPLFQAATANFNPWTEAKVKSKNPDRGPLLIIDGEKDNTVPWAIANASFKKQKRNKGVTEIVKMAGRGTRSSSTTAGAMSRTPRSSSCNASSIPERPQGRLASMPSRRRSRLRAKRDSSRMCASMSVQAASSPTSAAISERYG
jgi:hypothetical protein